MTTVTRSVTLAAPPAHLWKILTGLDRYADWESGYVSSVYTSDQHHGVGTTRRVELKSPMGVRYANHEVTRWEQGEAIAWAARETNFPFLQTAEQTVTLHPDGDGTRVVNQVAYTLRYGPVGALVDVLMFRRVVRGAAEGFLASLGMRAEHTR